MNDILARNKDLVAVPVLTAALLSLPLLAMQFGEEVQWTAFDFTVMGMMLTITGLLVVLVSRKISNPSHRYVAMIAVLAVFLVIWGLAATAD